jgi:serine/threonine-protein kinase
MIIQKAMAKMPADRYQSMAELDEALAAYEPGDGDITLMNAVVGAGGLVRATSTGVRRSGAHDKQVRTVTMARPMILLLGALGLFWAAGSLVMAITAILRLIRGGGARANLEAGEAVLLVLGVVFTLLTPVILAARWLFKNVWSNSMKAVDLADRLRGPVLTGLSAYGFGSLLVRILESVLLRHAVGVAWPVWDLLMVVIGMIAAGGAFFVAQAEKPKAS